jgi:hypothetical protein
MERVLSLRIAGLIAGCILAGCGGKPSAPGFPGTYVGSLTTVYTCGSNAPPTHSGSTTLTLTQSGETVLFNEYSCMGIPASVSGEVATVGMYTCAAGSYNGNSAAVNITGGTLTLNGTSLAVSINGTTPFTDARNGTMETCQITVTGTMTNESGGDAG